MTNHEIFEQAQLDNTKVKVVYSQKDSKSPTYKYNGNVLEVSPLYVDDFNNWVLGVDTGELFPDTGIMVINEVNVSGIK